MLRGVAAAVALLCAVVWTATARAQPEPDTGAESEPPPSSGTLAEKEHERSPLILATGEQEPTVPPDPRGAVYDDRPYYHDRWYGPREGVAGGVSFGVALTEGLEQGYYGRLEAGAYEIQRRRRGFIVGMLVGLEGWGAKDSAGETAGGGGLPFSIFGGIQSDAFFFALAGGFDLVVVDRVSGHTGIGGMAPMGTAYLGFDLEGVRFLADARALYRWQLGAEDRRMFQLGGTVQLTTD